MTFMWDNSTRQIQGIKAMPINTTTVQSLAKGCQQKQSLFLLCLQINQQLPLEDSILICKL